MFSQKVKDEMLMEFRFMDLDLRLSYLEYQIAENDRTYNYFMRQKLTLEEID